jgi:hypothetical protein
LPRPFRQRRGVRVGLSAVAVLLALAVAAPSARAAPAGPATARQAPSEAENYVQWVYESLLFRPADPGGLAYWTALVEAHGPGPFVHFIVTSDEWRGSWVNAFYESIWLDRPADAGALAYWKDYLAANHGFDGFEASLGGSDEGYQLSGGTDADYVNYVYNAATFRTPTDDERDDALDALATGSNAQFVGSVLLSADGLGSRVQIAYERTLAREADPGGLAYWSTFYRQTGSMSQMLAAQILSDEAWEVAQVPVAEPTELRSLVEH